MIADVCRLGPSGSRHRLLLVVVRPVMPTVASKDLRQVFEVWHRFDPSRSPALRPKDWGPGISPSTPLFPLSTSQPSTGLHALSDHPKVHVPIINYALRANAITADKARTRAAKYADIVSPECDQQIELSRPKHGARGRGRRHRAGADQGWPSSTRSRATQPEVPRHRQEKGKCASSFP